MKPTYDQLLESLTLAYEMLCEYRCDEPECNCGECDVLFRLEKTIAKARLTTQPIPETTQTIVDLEPMTIQALPRLHANVANGLGVVLFLSAWLGVWRRQTQQVGGHVSARTTIAVYANLRTPPGEMSDVQSCSALFPFSSTPVRKPVPSAVHTAGSNMGGVDDL